MAVLRSHNFNSLTVSSTQGDNVIQQKQTLAPSTNIVAVNDFGYKNNTALKVILDYSLGYYNNNWRAEARWDADTSLWEQWHSFVVFVPNEYVRDSIQETISQHHGGGGAFSPSVSFRLNVSNLIIRHNTGTVGDITTQSLTTFQTPFASGVWNKITLKVGYFADSTGYLKVWVNRNIVYNYAGPIHFVGASSPPTSYKIGIYDSTRSSTPPIDFTSRTLFYDEYRFANTLDNDWDTFIALDADGLPALSGIDPPVIPPDPDPVRKKFRGKFRIEPIV
jgi:hypothetical protein